MRNEQNRRKPEGRGLKSFRERQETSGIRSGVPAPGDGLESASGIRRAWTEQLHEVLYHKILDGIDMTQTPDDEELQTQIYEEIRAVHEEQYLYLQERINLGKSLYHSFRKLDLLQELIEEPAITEIMVNGPEHIFIESAGEVSAVDRTFPSTAKLEDVVQQIAAASNRIVNESSPIVDARLEDGSRVNIVLPPVALDGPVVTIRKFPTHPMTMDELIARGALTTEAAVFLQTLVCAGYNLFISGGTGAGKTTFLNALSAYIPRNERIITIEDNAELQLLDKPNLVRMEARNRNIEGTGEITIRDLIRTALRMRPDRIIVGEVRSEEAVDMIQAMNTGHDGSLSTGHANSPADMLSRLETMILMGLSLPLPAIRRQLASGLDCIVHLSRMPDHSRKVQQIVEIDGYENEEIRLRTLFSLEEGVLKRKGNLKHTDKLELAGISGDIV